MSYTAVSIYIIIILFFKKVGSARLRESGVHPISPKTPAPQYQPIDRKKRKGKKCKTKVGIEQRRPIKKHCPLSHQHCPTIKYGVSKIVPEGHREGNKSPAVLQGSTARRYISVPMCDQRTTCNQPWHILYRYSTIKRVHWVTPDLIKHTQVCHGSTMRNVTLEHTPK